MTFQQFFRAVFYFILFTGCIAPLNTFAEEDEEYFLSWELQHSGKLQLIWFFTTAKDYTTGQPNRVLADNKEFIIHPDVRPPTINGLYLLEHSKVNEGEDVLDIGTGSGIHAIFAAEKAKRVVATDIYAPAIENAKINAKLNNVDHKIDFRLGDLFEPIKDGEKFDAFFFNINYPFNDDDSERKQLHERLFAEIRTYMKPKARIYYQVSFIRTFPYIYEMLMRNRFHIMEVHMENMQSSQKEPLFIMIQSD